MSLERIPLEHSPPNYRVYGALFRDVSNAPFLQTQLISRNPEFEYAFIDASTIVSRAHLLAAVWNAVYSSVEGNLRTPNVHSEVVASLNINNNVRSARSYAYRGCRLTPQTDCRRVQTMGYNV